MFSTTLKLLLGCIGLVSCYQQSMGQASGKPDFNASFVRVSQANPYYFELSNGEPYVPIGANLCWTDDGNMDTLESFFKKTAQNGGNYARVWLSHPMFEIENPDGNGINQQAVERIDRVFELARTYRIKIKLCLEHFRRISPEKEFTTKTYYHKDKGGSLGSMDEYIHTAEGRRLYLNRVDFLQKRYGSDPVVFGWELWNEMNAIKADSIQAWNESMLPTIHARFPKNLVMQSLGSFSTEQDRPIYQFINQLASNDVAQVHRYIDPGAPLAICTAPMDVLASNAIDELRAYQVTKPMLLAEVGAVKANHTGASELNLIDTAGTMLHDQLFAPFFSGAAGTGMAWYWAHYVNRHNLWYHFQRFGEAIKGVNPIQERFIPLKIPHPQLRIYALVGRKTILIWCRDSGNGWQQELVNGITPKRLHGLTVDVESLLPKPGIKAIRFYDPWTNTWQTGQPGATLSLPDFRRSMVVKIDRE